MQEEQFGYRGRTFRLPRGGNRHENRTDIPYVSRADRLQPRVRNAFPRWVDADLLPGRARQPVRGLPPRGRAPADREGRLGLSSISAVRPLARGDDLDDADARAPLGVVRGAVLREGLPVGPGTGVDG